MATTRLVSLAQVLGSGPAARTAADPISTAEQRDYQAGFAAANARIAAVMNSYAGKANPAAAVFMITETNASAETIIAKLPKFGGGVASFPAGPNAGGDPLKLWGEVQRDSAPDGNSASAPADDPWAAVQGSTQPIGSC